MAPPSTDERPAGAPRRSMLHSRLGVTRLQSSGDNTIRRSATKIVRPPLLRKDSKFRRSRRPDEPFAYTSLQKQRTIRLLKLDKRSVTDRRPLGYILTTVNLPEAPAFYALSYCWGSARRDKDIVCNGKLLSVTAHLKRGIQELQAIPMLAGSWIWIDQISINQDDLDERSHQVAFMNHIYCRAIRTIVWLGPSDGPCEGGYGLAERLFELCQRQEYSSFNLGWKLRHPKRKLIEELDDCLRLALPRVNSPPWTELDKMLRKPWFRRIWIIQEVTLSNETPVLVYGGKARDFMPLLLAGRWIGGSKILPISESPALTPLRNFCLQDLYTIFNFPRHWTLEALLLHTLDHEATDPRDHIFALLGIRTWDLHVRQWELRQDYELHPDYKSPPWEIFQRATRYMIKDSGSLTSLLLVGSTSGVKDDAHPSWVPDYGAKPTMPCPTGAWPNGGLRINVTVPWRASGNLFIRLKEKEDDRALGIELGAFDEILWKAAGTTDERDTSTDKSDDSTLLQENQDDRKLPLEGFEVDEILWTSAGATDERDDSILFRWLEGAAGAVLWSFDSFHDSVDYDSVLTGFFDAFVRIVCAVYEDGTYRAKLADVFEYMDVQEAAENPREGYFRTMRTRILGSVLRETAPAKSCQVSQLVEYFTTRYWDIFLTKGGELGVARRPGRLGDTVAVLQGGAMPFILRPVGEDFELLGPCVVLKWMDGLAVQMWKQDKIEKSTFTLV